MLLILLIRLLEVPAGFDHSAEVLLVQSGSDCCLHFQQRLVQLTCLRIQLIGLLVSEMSSARLLRDPDVVGSLPL